MYLMSIAAFFISSIPFSLKRYAIFLMGQRRPPTLRVLKFCEVAVKELNSGLCPSSLIFKTTSKVSWRATEATGSAGLAAAHLSRRSPAEQSAALPFDFRL